MLEARFLRQARRVARQRNRVLIDFLAENLTEPDIIERFLRLPVLPGDIAGLIDRHVIDSWIEGVLSARTETTLSVDRLQVIPKEAIDFVRARRELYRFFDSAVINDVRDTLVRILEQGLNLRDAKRALRQTLSTYSGPRLANTARTESITAFNQGRLATFRADPDFVIAVQFLAIVDPRTTEICKSRDGLILALNSPLLEMNTPPLHFQCRSLLSPIDKFEADDLRGDMRLRSWLRREHAKWEQPMEENPRLPGFAVVPTPGPVVDPRKVTPVPEALHPEPEFEPEHQNEEDRRRAFHADLRKAAQALNRKQTAAKRADRFVEAGRLIFEEVERRLDSADAARQLRAAKEDLRIAKLEVRRLLNEGASRTSAQVRKYRGRANQALQRRNRAIDILKRFRAEAILEIFDEAYPGRKSFNDSDFFIPSDMLGFPGETRETYEERAKIVKTMGGLLPNHVIQRITDKGGRALKIIHSDRGYFEATFPDQWIISLGHESRPKARQQATAIHELGHAYEEAQERVLQASVAFLTRRTTDASGKREKLRTIPGYSSKEKARFDKFATEYVGKNYASNDGVFATEILSMGWEGIFSGRHDIWDEDPEHAQYSIGALLFGKNPRKDPQL